jgi:ATP-dependent DNA ligase
VITPMLARLARELPLGDYVYEPKWDGFRCLVFRDGANVDLRSRNGRPLARYFPELVDALRAVPETNFILDGEIVVASAVEFDFAALLARLHPAASRVNRLRSETPSQLIAFDLLAVGGTELSSQPFAERRRNLERLMAGTRAPLFVTPLTDDPKIAAAWLDRYQGGGIDGVVAKHRELRYEPGRRSMVKVKHEHTAECVVAGFRVFADRPLPSSLLLGLYDDIGALRHVGIASAFSAARRRELLALLRPLVVPLAGHPWERGFQLAGSPTGRLPGAAGRWSPDEMEHDWVPVAPELVCEVAYDQVDDLRFRHPARFRRWRPDRDAATCTLDQLAAAPARPAELLAS